MISRTSLWGLVVTAMVYVPSTDVQAGGLIQQPPKDGDWVCFNISASGSQGKVKTGSLQLAAVGSAMLDGVQGRWIEITQTWDDDSSPDYLMKLLIADGQLQKDGIPYQHILKGWIRITTGEESKIQDLTQGPGKPQACPFALFLTGPTQKVEQLAPKTVKTEAGEYSCRGFSGTYDFSMLVRGQQQTVNGDVTARVHDSVPFGVVSYRQTIPNANVTMKLTIRKFGTDAESELPDHR